MFDTDLLIIGSGLAGLWAAIAAKEGGVEKVAIVDKGSIGKPSVEFEPVPLSSYRYQPGKQDRS